MSFNDLFRLSCHAVITDNTNRILQLKQTYNNKTWGLPGGSLEPGETIHEALYRECKEEIGIDVCIEYLSGVYYHSQYNSQVFIFRCNKIDDKEIVLSNEHSEYKYFMVDELSEVQKIRILDCLHYKNVVSRSF